MPTTDTAIVALAVLVPLLLAAMVVLMWDEWF